MKTDPFGSGITIAPRLDRCYHLYPCPFCGGVEGKDVKVGYKHPKFRITCMTCGFCLQDDRIDKVQAAWNMRNGITWLEQSFNNQ